VKLITNFKFVSFGRKQTAQANGTSKRHNKLRKQNTAPQKTENKTAL
jgi:hypothetical protein